jgi:ATP-dependent Clp protease ATP-binding subunit ClpA
MFERFTDQARRVVVLAQEEARGLHHDYIGTEHILLGLLSAEGSVAARVLAGLGLTLPGTREEVIARVGTGSGARDPKRIPFTPRAKKSLELSLREALALHHNYIGTEHILLGVVREGEGAGAQILAAHGADADRLRAEVLQLVPPGAETAEAGSRRRGVLRRPRQARYSTETAGITPEAIEDGPDEDLHATPGAEAALAQAARLAGSGRMGSHHLVLAALTNPSTAAAQVLAALGVDIEAAGQALRSADVTGTADELPQEAGRRQMVIRPAADRLTIELTDPVAIALGRQALEAAGGEAGADGEAGVIRGDQPENAPLDGVWLALRDSLLEIRRAYRPAGPGGPAETGAAETGPAETGAAETGAAETGPAEARAGEAGAAEARAGAAGAAEARAGENGPAEAGPAEAD